MYVFTDNQYSYVSDNCFTFVTVSDGNNICITGGTVVYEKSDWEYFRDMIANSREPNGFIPWKDENTPGWKES